MKLILFSCAFLFVIKINAQENFYLKATYGKGFILAHSQSLEHLAISHPDLLMVSFYNKTSGKKQWQSINNFPHTGVSLLLLNYNNPVLGKSIGLIPNFRFHFLSADKNPNMHFTIGLGPAYHTSPYDKKNNNKNNALGTRWTYGVITGLDGSVKVLDHLSFTGGINLTHFSNGSSKKPNAGINIISLTGGVSYHFNKEPVNFIYDSIPGNKERKLKLSAVLGTGVSETIKIGSGSYPFLNFAVLAEKRISQKGIIGGGIEYFHTISLREEIKLDHQLKGATPDFRRAALLLHYEHKISRISFLSEMGFYIYDQYKIFEPFYVRMGLRYNLTQHLFAGLAVKSHYFKAEAAEWRIGFRL